MVQVKNKKQGTIWAVEDAAMLKRMKADTEHYEILPCEPGNDQEKDKPGKTGK